MSGSGRWHVLKQRAVWQVRYVWSRTGPLELLAIAILLLWVSMKLVVINPLELYRDQLLSEAAILSHQAIKQGRAAPAASVPSTPSTKARFLAFLPPASQQYKAVNALHDLVNAHNLVLTHVDYKQSIDEKLPVHQLTLRLALEGNEDQLHAFVHDLLGKLPFLAIDRIELGRDGKTPDSAVLAMDVSLFFGLN